MAEVKLDASEQVSGSLKAPGRPAEMTAELHWFTLPPHTRKV